MYGMTNTMYLLTKWEGQMVKPGIWLEVMAYGPSAVGRRARAYHMTNSVVFCSFLFFCSILSGFSGTARGNAYGPHMGLSSMVQQRKR